MKYIIAISVVAALIFIYLLLYILNKKTPVPKGCEDIKDLESKCSSCTNDSCAFRKKEETHHE